MGLLTEGRILSWDETQKYTELIREHGVKQFIHVYNQTKDRQDDKFKWGDEV